MKKLFLLAIILFSGGLLFAQQSEIILTNFEGDHYPDMQYFHWSDELPCDTVDNPVTDGINTSNNCVFYPSHIFDSEWGPVPSFQIFGNLPSDVINDHDYFQFDVLIIQDTLFADDTLNFQLKFEGGDANEYSGIVKEVVWPGGGNSWKTVIIPYADSLKILNHNKVALLSSPSKNTTAAYYDNFGLTNSAVGVSKTYMRNDLNVSMVEEQLYVFMDEATHIDYVQIYDISGSLIMEKSINTDSKDFSVALNCNAGIYILKIKSTEAVFTKKFLKHK